MLSRPSTTAPGRGPLRTVTWAWPRCDAWLHGWPPSQPTRVLGRCAGRGDGVDRGRRQVRQVRGVAGDVVGHRGGGLDPEGVASGTACVCTVSIVSVGIRRRASAVGSAVGSSCWVIGSSVSRVFWGFACGGGLVALGHDALRTTIWPRPSSASTTISGGTPVGPKVSVSEMPAPPCCIRDTSPRTASSSRAPPTRLGRRAHRGEPWR